MHRHKEVDLLKILKSTKLWTFMGIMVFALGCGVSGEQSKCSGEHSYTEAQVDKYGLTLMPTDSMYLSFGQTTQAYGKVMTCMGMTAPGPTVEFLSFSERYWYGSAFYHVPTQWIYINNDESDAFPRDCKSDMEFLKHEMIHHILRTNGYDEESKAHDPDYFLWECI